ncbi:hypothetical protein AHAS_Ahas13G0172400 [Arachis hypogaea]
MGHFPETQYDPDFDESNNYSYCDWESQNQRNLSNPYCDEFNNSSNCDSEDLLQKSRGIFERQEQSWKRQEALFKNMNGDLEKIRRSLEPLSKKNEGQLMDMKEKVEEQDKEATASSELSMKNEVVENKNALEVTKEHSQPSQTSLESVIEKYEEEMKKSWEEQQTSSIKELLSQMLGAKKGVEEHESKEVIPENSHSSEVENHMKEGLMEPQYKRLLMKKSLQ